MLVGIVILLIQNFVDLGLEIPGVCVALFLLLGALHGDAGSTSESTRRPRWRANRLASAYAICVVALSGLVLLRARNVADERTRLARIEKHIDIKNDAHRAAFRAELKQAMCRFPAEPFFPQLGGAFAFRAADQNPLPWIQRALERGMGNGRTHLLLALVLERRGYRAQARMQLRLALNRSPDLANEAARIALRSTSKLAELMSAVPQGGSGVPMLERLAARAKDPALREAFDKETLARDSTRPAPLFRLGSALVATVAAGGCDASCTKNIDKHVKSLDDAAPDGSLGAQLRARQLSALGQQDKALEMLATRCRQVTDRTACLAERARLAAAARSKHFTPAAKDYLLVACVDIRSCARAHSWIGDRYASLQNWPLALSNYQKAAKFEPKAERWLAVAKTATNAQLHAAAVEAIERVLKDKRFANDKKTRAWLAREHDLLIGATIEK